MSFDFSRLSEPQINALANVAFGGNGGGQARQTLKSLERRGLIRATVERWTRGRFPVDVTVWSMPLRVHIDFCRWCEENAPVEESA